MKVFEFDPATGRIIDFIEHRKVAGWADCSLEFAASKGKPVPSYILPKRPDAQFTCHIDGGVEHLTADGIEFVSYRHPTKWIAFCVGKWQAGEGEHYWEWWILPSIESFPVT